MDHQNLDNKNSQVFGSFFLGTNEFAIAVETVREVVNPPENYTVIPLSPTYLRGIFNLRGSVIPVIDLRCIFQSAESIRPELSKIAIIEYGKYCVGVLFDRTGEVFRSIDEERSNFEKDTRAQSDRVISGVFKKDKGERIIQILDVEEIFKLEKLPFHPNDVATEKGKSRLLERRGNRKQCISFVVGPSRCALTIDSIHEILKVDHLNDSSLSDRHCIGNIELRGTTIPIVDFTALLGFREADRSSEATKGDRRVIVMRLERELFGLLVDAVESIITFFSDEMIQFPVIVKDREEMFLGCISRAGEKDILLLDHLKILSNSEINEITHGHNKIYKISSDEQGAATDAKSNVRRTFITFTLENHFAVAIEDIKEIIEFPKELLTPPGLPRHCKGVLNLRGELVAIVDARVLYALQTKDLQESKVLILKSADLKYGLVVDTVDSIISFSESEKLHLPDSLFRKSGDQIVDDVTEAVEVNTLGSKTSLLLLNTQAVHTRVGKFKAA